MKYVSPLTSANKRLIELVYKVYPDDPSLKHWEEQISMGAAYILEQYNGLELVFACIVEIHKDCLDVVAGGGIDGQIDALKILRDIESTAKDMNKSTVRITGRLGWWRGLRKHGYKKMHSYPAKNGRLIYIFERVAVI